MGFILGYLYVEWVALLKLGYSWVRYRNTEASLLEDAKRLQAWWAQSLLNLGKRLYNLEFNISGLDAVHEGVAALVIPRHTSLGDTVLPLIYFALQRGEGMRYILKSELEIIPCLDVAGNRLPNLFVDRSGSNTDAELNRIRELTRESGANESVLIYVEGTRATSAKRENLSEKRPQLKEQLARWPDLLPPRTGGLSAMLQANPQKDVVLLAHTGFEAAATLGDLTRGGWNGQTVRLHFWRIPYAELPDGHDPAEVDEFIAARWDEMQSQVSRLKAL